MQVLEVHYCGHIFTSNGLKIDCKKVRATVGMERPSSKPAVLRLLGMINYLSRYLPQLADMATPIHELSKENVLMIWSWEQEEGFVNGHLNPKMKACQKRVLVMDITFSKEEKSDALFHIGQSRSQSAKAIVQSCVPSVVQA